MLPTRPPSPLRSQRISTIRPSSMTAMRVSSNDELERISRVTFMFGSLKHLRAGSAAGAPDIDGLGDPSRTQRHDQRGAAVADERQRHAGDGQEADRHAGIDQKLG